MAQYTRAQFEALYGTTGTSFPDNTTGLITELVTRTFGKDLSDSFINSKSDLQLLTTAAGTDTYTVTGSIASYATGFGIFVKFTNANTGASTLNVNSLGAKSIKKNGSSDVASGDINAGQGFLLIYDGTNFIIIGSVGGGVGSQDLQSVLDEGSTATGPMNVSDSGIGIEINGGNATLGQLSGSAGGAFMAEDFGAKILTDRSGPDPAEGSLYIVGSDGWIDELAIGSSGQALLSNGTTAAWGALPPKVVQLAASDETTALTTGTAKITFRMPYAMTLTAIRASLSTAQATGSILTVDVNEGGTTILSTKITIDNTEKTSTTAATAPVISDSALADDAEITVDIDQIGDGTAKGLKVTLIGV